MAAGVDAETLGRICSGVHRPTVAELAGLLQRAGTGLRVRLEVYDDHDDGLHLSAVADPSLTTQSRWRAPRCGTCRVATASAASALSPPASTAADELAHTAHTVAIAVDQETVPVRCADLVDIVRSKETADRFKDREDLAVLVQQLEWSKTCRRVGDRGLGW